MSGNPNRPNPKVSLTELTLTPESRSDTSAGSPGTVFLNPIGSYALSPLNSKPKALPQTRDCSVQLFGCKASRHEACLGFRVLKFSLLVLSFGDLSLSEYLLQGRGRPRNAGVRGNAKHTSSYQSPAGVVIQLGALTDAAVVMQLMKRQAQPCMIFLWCSQDLRFVFGSSYELAVAELQRWLFGLIGAEFG